MFNYVWNFLLLAYLYITTLMSLQFQNLEMISSPKICVWYFDRMQHVMCNWFIWKVEPEVSGSKMEKLAYYKQYRKLFVPILTNHAFHPFYSWNGDCVQFILVKHSWYQICDISGCKHLTMLNYSTDIFSAVKLA